MGRRRDNEVPVSLFAFQDIITSITGIMILVVLLIILDILNAPKTKSSPFKKDVVQLEKTVKRLREKLDKESRWLDENEREILKAASVELSALPKLIEKEKKRFLLLTVGFEREKKRNAESETLIAGIKKQVEKAGEDIRKTKDDRKRRKGILEEKNKNLDDLTKKLEEAKKNSEKRKTQVEITTDKNLPYSPILVECSECLIKIKVGPSGAVRRFDSPGGDSKALVSRFFTFLKSRSKSDDLIILILKPSSVGYSYGILGAIKSLGFKYNIEPMEENKTGVYE